MNQNDLTKYSQKFIQYLWDPMPTNDDDAPIWCLGQRYESHAQSSENEPPAHADYNDKAVEAAATVVSDNKAPSTKQTAQADPDEASKRGWPKPFIDDLESRIWLTYRSGFPLIARPDESKSTLPWLQQLRNPEGFTSDTGWGCMIRSGQCLLANTLMILQLGRSWRVDQDPGPQSEILSLFADHPDALYSIHRFVQHGAAACGKQPGQWFGPSATARCIQALTAGLESDQDRAHKAGLRVYVRPDDSDVYEDALLKVARDTTSGIFQPTLILLGTRLGIDRINPVYYRSLCQALQMPQSIGIAGGRPDSSHYFVGSQSDTLFYLDPHTTRPMLPRSPGPEDVATCHTRRLRRIAVSAMDPSMLLGFLVRDEADWRDWRRRIEMPVATGQEGQAESGQQPVVHIHNTSPSYSATGSLDGSNPGERSSAVDEVLSCGDDSGDESFV